MKAAGILTSGEAAAQSVTVNWAETHQTIDGFGVSQTAADPSANDDANGFAAQLARWPHTTEKSVILDKTFSASAGIGLTILRSKIRPTLQPTADPNVWDYTDIDQVYLMKQAVARGPVKLMGTVWSPPAWMKENLSTYGGTCNVGNAPCQFDAQCPGSYCNLSNAFGVSPSYYQAYATYLSRYALQYASANGVSIYAVSMANEPDQTVAWDSCNWTSPELATFLAGPLSQTFSNNGVGALVIAPETAHWDRAEALLYDTRASSNAWSRLNIIGSHIYNGDPAAFVNPISYNKQVWQTEASEIHPVWTIDGALAWAKSIHTGLVIARVNAWLWFNLAQKESVDPNDPASRNDYSLIALDYLGTNQYLFSKTFWALGNFSKFVRPGFVRIGTNSTSVPLGVDISAFRDPVTDQFVVIVVNGNAYSTALNFTVNGFNTHEVTPYVTSATQDLAVQAPTYLSTMQPIPPKSIVTYVSRTRNFQLWANAPNAKAIAGDFTGDGKADIALAGGDGWNSVPVAISLGNGTFSVKNFGLADFALWANAPGAKVVAGDVNRDGRDDLIVTGGPGWTSIPVALSNGDGSFYTTNLSNSSLPALSRVAGVKVLAGDVNNDGRDDLIMTGGSGSPWVANTIPVGLASATTPGAFTLSYFTVPANGFSVWAQDPTARASVSDFNGDGRADIVLTGGANWTTLPVAMANTNGTFTVTNVTNASLPAWSRTTGAKMLTGCRRTVALPDHPTWHRCNDNGGVGGDLRGDIVLTGGVGWSSIKVGFGTGNGAFSPVTDNAHATFAGWAQGSSVKALSGDFDGNGRADIALVGGDQWWTVPMAFSFGNGWFSVVNYPID